MEELNDTLIREFLEDSPIYAVREYRPPQVNRTDLQIDEIEAHCPICKKSRPFQAMTSRGGGAGIHHSESSLKSGVLSFSFTCASCKKSDVAIVVEHVVSKDKITLMKFGEIPRKQLNRDPVLQRFFVDDSDNYEKAIVCLSNGYGIGAFAYFRRIVENNIHKLLELIRNDAELSERNVDIVSAIDELKKESPMSEKIKLANKALPEYLVPNGLNPLLRLYQVLSDGVHELTDSECLQKSKEIQECILFIASELSTRQKHRDRFKSSISKL